MHSAPVEAHRIARIALYHALYQEMAPFFPPFNFIPRNFPFHVFFLFPFLACGTPELSFSLAIASGQLLSDFAFNFSLLLSWLSAGHTFETQLEGVTSPVSSFPPNVMQKALTDIRKNSAPRALLSLSENPRSDTEIGA